MKMKDPFKLQRKPNTLRLYSFIRTSFWSVKTLQNPGGKKSATMLIKFLPQIGLLRPTVTHINLPSSRPIPFLNRLFPFKLQYCLYGPNFSIRPVRAASSKSLIEDEAELSDWVSDLGKMNFDEDVPGGGDKRKRKLGDKSTRRMKDQDSSFSKTRTRREELGGYERQSVVRFGSPRRGNERGGGSDRNVNFKKAKNEPKGRFGLVTDNRDDVKESLGTLIHEEDTDDAEGNDDHDDVLKKNVAFSMGLDKEVSLKSSPSSPRDDNYLSITRFDQCSISPLSLKATKDAGYERLTIVQEATLPVILEGKDVLAKARTGTGKTVAFLLPSIEVVLKSPPVGHDKKHPPILVLVVCPTRELALQASTEANTLLKYHPSIGAQVVIGGTRLALEQKQMQANPCQILVGTPGRLRDHLANTPGFATRLMGLKVLVFDEADRLLDMGFRKDIERIVEAVPSQRQTLMFSATVPQEVHAICHIALKRDYKFINTVEEGTEETHAQVQQIHLIAPLNEHYATLFALLKDHVADNVDYKVLVFCTTANVTRLVAALLGELKLNIREIHSRKPQNYRTRVSDEFRKSKGLILVTSDVSARGVDYPDVTLVIQVGLPADREQYIHRLGRTGRKGKLGQGILLLAPWEDFFLSTIKDLPISKAPAPLVDPDTKKKVQQALSNVGKKDKDSAYMSWLGYYNSHKKVGKDKYRVVELANEYSQSIGLDTPPALLRRVVSKMGLSNVPGLRLQ